MKIPFVALTVFGSIVAITRPAWSAEGLPTTVDAERQTQQLVVACKLPTQVRKMSGGMVIPLPGRVQNVTVAECTQRGGRYQLQLAADSAATKSDPFERERVQ